MSIIRRRQFKRRKKGLSTGKKKILILDAVLLLVFFIGMGYSMLGTDLGINGDVSLKKYEAPTLYNVMRNNAEEGTYAKEYLGSHQDSMAGVGNEKIYYWYAPSTTAGNTLASTIQDKWNVIFANHCWQMIRTTDTGGVKMIYNGEAENNQCLNTRGSHIGYAKEITTTLSENYYYGTSYTYNSSTGKFSLDGTITTGQIKTKEYTCKSTSSTGTCSTLYLVSEIDDIELNEYGYNVIPLKLTTNYSQFGILQFNHGYDTSSSIGAINYMFNEAENTGIMPLSTEEVLSLLSLDADSTYYYGTSYTYNTSNFKNTLTNPSTIDWSTAMTTLIDKYVCMETNTSSCTELYYVTQVEDHSADGFYDIYGYDLSYGKDLADFNKDIYVGDGYTDNGNGTFTLTNAVHFNRRYWYDNYSSYNSNNYTCTNLDGTDTCTYGIDRMYATSSHGYSYATSIITKIYAKSVTYNTTTNKYELDSTDRIQFWDRIGNNSNISTYHYTCDGPYDSCSELYYLNYSENYDLWYVILKNGDKIEDMINNTFYIDGVNNNDSTIKIGLDSWYKKYLNEYSSYLEDTIYCTDRTISDYGGWNANGGTITSKLVFSTIAYNNLSCTNLTDKFSLSNNKAKLNYPVGLLTYQEERLITNNNLRVTGSSYWLGTPYNYYQTDAYLRVIGKTGNTNTYSDATYGQGVRPAISLKPGTEYASGTGSMADPYIIE